MNEFTINYRDNRVEDFNKSSFDCFLFDSFKITDIISILNGEVTELKQFLLPEKIKFLSSRFNYPDRHILSKVSLINSIIQNDPYSKAFLVFQSISWKLAKIKMPYIFIPVRILDNGLKIVKNGEVFINPLVKKYVDEDINIDVHSNKIQEIDSPKLTKIINEANGRIVYEMYLTHFKVEYPLMKTKINKKFMKKNHFVYKDIQNRNVLALDNELTQVFDNISEGLNTIVKAKQGTRKISLIANLVASSIDNNKDLLYVSEKSYSSLKSTLKDLKLLPFVYDTYGNNLEEVERIDYTDYDKRELRDLIDDLYDYQDKFSYQFKGYTFKEVFKELLKLEDKEKSEMEVEFVENLTFDDVEKIKETLIELEKVLNELNMKSPSDSHLNDLIVREIVNNEDDMLFTTSSLINELKKLKRMLIDIREDFGFVLPYDLKDLKENVSHLDYLDVEHYPESWFESIDNFEEAKELIDKTNNITGRTMSLYTIINSTYKSEIFNLDVDTLYDSLFGDVFTSDDKQIINYILSKKSAIKKEISAINTLIERFKIYKNYFESNLNLELDKDLIEFTDHLSKITDKFIFSKFWFEIVNGDEMINELFAYISIVESYYMDYNSIKSYFKDKVTDLDLRVVQSYSEKFEKSTELDKLEISSSAHIVEKCAYPSYFTISKKNKKALIKRLLSVIKLKDSITEIKEIVKEKTSIDFDLESLEEVIETMEDTFDFVDKYRNKPGFSNLTKNFEKLNFKEINTVNLQFKYDLNEFNKLIEDQFYQSYLSDSFSEMEKNFRILFKQINNIFELDSKIKDIFLKRPNKLTVDSFKTIKNTLSNYKLNNSYLLSNKDKLTKLYGGIYKGKATVFKPIRVAIKNFEKFYKFFTDYETLKHVCFNKSKNLYESVYKVSMTLNNVYVMIDEVKVFFDVVFKDEDIDDIIAYFEMYVDKDNLLKWLHYLELNHVLRMYGQFRLASDINNGYRKNNLLNTFTNAYYKKLINMYFVKEDNSIFLNKMSRFNDLLELRNQDSISYITNKRSKSKIVLSNISGLKSIKNRHYDLMIIDGAEMIHKNYFNKLTHWGKQLVVIGDEQNFDLADSVFNMLNYPMYELKNNYRLSLHLFDKFGSGVVVGQSIKVIKEDTIIDEIIDEFRNNKRARVNVICFNEETRKNFFNSVADNFLKDELINKDFYNYVDRIKILYYTNYIPSGNNTYIITDINNHSGLTNTIRSALRNTRNLTIVDSDNILSDKRYKRLRETLLTDKVNLYTELTDEISLKLTKELGGEYIYKKGVSPFDFVIFKGNEIKALVKITFNITTDNDILEESHMIYDKEYDNYNKIVISLDDLYFKREEIIRKMKDVIEDE